MKQFPNLMVVGAMRAGTTTLYEYLKDHPDISMSSIKEPNFFASDVPERDYIGTELSDQALHEYLSGEMINTIHSTRIRRWEDYQQLFRRFKNATVVGEASPSYLCSPVAAANIHNRLPDTKIVILLRDPVHRAYSHYQMDFGKGRTKLPFMQAIRREVDAMSAGHASPFGYLGVSLYAEQVDRYLNVFGGGQVKIFLFEDLCERPQEVLGELAEFLGIPEHGFRAPGERHNPSASPHWPLVNYFLHQSGAKSIIRKVLPRPVLSAAKGVFYRPAQREKLSAGDVEMLQDIFASDIQRTSIRIDRDLSRWTLTL